MRMIGPVEAKRAALPALLIAAATTLLALGSCTRSEPAAALRVHLSAEPVSLDPSLAEDGVSMKVLHNLMEGLVGYDEKGKLEPRLAESWKVSPDGLRYEFTLRPGARWSDGKAVEPDDFVTALRRTLAPATASRTGALFDPIRRARDVRLGKAPPESLGVSARRDPQGAYVVVELERKASWIVHALTLVSALPQRADVLQANGGRWPENGPVTGAYRIVTHQRDQRIVLERSSLPLIGSQGSQPGLAGDPPAQVELIIVPDENTASNLFDQGKLDVLAKLPPLEIKRYRENGTLRIDPFVATWYVAFNVRKKPFDQVGWRRAVSGAIRKEEAARMLGSGELPGRSWIPLGLEGAEPFSEIASHLEATRAHRGKGAALPQVTAGYDSSTRNTLLMEKIQHDVAAATGLKLQLTHQDWRSYVRQLHTDPPALYRFGWLAPFLDPITHLQVFVTGDPNNYSGWSNRDYDRQVAEIAGMEPGAGRERKIRDAQAILVEQEAVVVPVSHYVQSHAVAARVKGFAANAFGVVSFARMRLSRP